ncbi:MAG: hypothetical protein MPN21_10285 [Thermoanaerobaculia bacterium]|nr:hypothetical protein [Thermoanaerobaculia bacterium]
MAPKRDRRRRSRRNDGFTIVWLAVTVTLLNVWVAASLPLWSFQIQRDKEADMIFRGLQIAEGIRVYLARTGQYPTSLEQMTEHEPRCLRRVWENPLREDGRWALIPVGAGGPGQGGRQTGPDGRPIQNPGDAQGGAGEPTGLPDQGGLAPGQGEDGLPAGTILSAPPNQDGFSQTPRTVAFRGVYHPGSEDPTRLFLDSDIISEWQFTLELVSAMRQGTPTAPLTNPRPFPVDQIGRPWPPGVTPPIAMPTPEGHAPKRPGGDGSGHPPVGDNRPPDAQSRPPGERG